MGPLQTNLLWLVPLEVFGRAGVKSIINPLHNTVNQDMPSVSRLFDKMFSSVFSFTVSEFLFSSSSSSSSSFFFLFLIKNIGLVLELRKLFPL